MITITCAKCKAKIKVEDWSEVADFVLSVKNMCYGGHLCAKCEEEFRREWLLYEKPDK